MHKRSKVLSLLLTLAMILTLLPMAAIPAWAAWSGEVLFDPDQALISVK